MKQDNGRPVFFGKSEDPGTRMLTRPVTVLEKGVYRGAHYFSLTPMIRVMLDLGRMEDWPSNRIAGFTDRLIELLPGLHRHGCSLRRRGGFVERLRDGTWLGHVVEHVALELQSMVGPRVTRGKTRSVPGRPGVYNVMFAYAHEEAGLLAGRLALEIVNSLLPAELAGMERLERIAEADGAFEFERRLQQLRAATSRASFGPTTQSLVDEAKRRGIPVMRLDEASLVQLGHGRYQKRIRASISGDTPLVAADLAGNKHLTKKLLDESGIPVPRGVVVRNVDEALREARRLGFPLVTKPLDGNHGRGITIGIQSEEQLRFGFEHARGHSRSVIVEPFFAGRDHRILVIGGKLVAVAERVPAHVIGDGTKSIARLIEQVNEDPRRGDGHEKVMTRIKVDAHVTEYLARSGLTVDSVPAAGDIIMLRATANLSTGGTAVDRTNEIHFDNAEIARRAALIIGLDIAGIDFVCPDITRSVRETGGGVIEVNAAPGFRMHLEPSEGPPRDVARPVLEMLYPRGRQSRVPIISITGTNGKSTTARMLKHVLRYTGCSIGLTSTTGVYVDDVLVMQGDATGPRSARMVLRDPTVDVAVLETARGGILREGLGYDRADIGAVLNISADHLGLKGIETLEDLAWVKSLVVETVSRRGTSVLNADDPQCVRMARRAGGRLAWFSLHGGDDMPPVLRRHVEHGGMAVVREPGPEGGTIVLHQAGQRQIVMKAGDIPATLHGMATFNIANALACIAMAVAHDVPLLTIRSALSMFQSNFEQNPGRLNVHDAHGFRVIMDYAHNAAGLRALGDVINGLRHRYRRTIGAVTIPGDRRDEDIIEVGQIAAGMFDELVFREDPATRGRPRGEVMGLLQEGAVRAGATPDHMHLIAGEAEAAAAALTLAQPGELVVITPTDVFGCWEQVRSFRKVETASAPNGHVIAAE
ncbi:cyanophycin synthetase [Sphingomonas arenae]|uniref:cyanophycin synthetase n=1 Tax=Sphingomonas arenae TaxID=2812555 RepID=UPI001F0205B5|nr:cyanophycin synthetase [Sphingomonas arenae]